MSEKDKLLRRHARWFKAVCDQGLNPDDVKRETVRERIRLERTRKRISLLPYEVIWPTK